MSFFRRTPLPPALQPSLPPLAVPPPPVPPTPDVPGLSLQAARTILKQIEQVGVDPYAVDPRCTHCRGLHDKACPRVRSMEFSPAGQLIGVVFWKSWNSDDVLWPEQVVEIVMKAEQDELDLKAKG